MFGVSEGGGRSGLVLFEGGGDSPWWPRAELWAPRPLGSLPSAEDAASDEALQVHRGLRAQGLKYTQMTAHGGAVPTLGRSRARTRTHTHTHERAHGQ